MLAAITEMHNAIKPNQIFLLTVMIALPSRRTASLAGFLDLSHVFDGPAIGRMALLVCQIQMFQTPL